MRVLILIDDSDSRTAKETVCRRWSRLVPLLASRCENVTLVTLRERGPLHVALGQRSYGTVALRCGPRWKTPLAIVRLARFLRRNPVDVVHGHETIPALIAGTAAIASRTATSRIYFREHTEGSFLHNFVSRLTTTVTTWTIGASDAVARYAAEVDGAVQERIEVVPNGVEAIPAPDRGEIERLRGRLGVSVDDFVVVCVARLRAEKGLDTLIEAMNLLGRNATNAPHLIVVGAGPEEHLLRGIASRHETFVSHFVGYQSELSPWYGIADVVCAPSRREAFGLVVVEAMAASKAVVASRAGGLSEIIRDGISGCLVPANDAVRLSSVLTRLRDDPTERERLAAVGHRAFQSKFTLESMADRWIDSYRRSIGSDRVRDPT